MYNVPAGTSLGPPDPRLVPAVVYTCTVHVCTCIHHNMKAKSKKQDNESKQAVFETSNWSYMYLGRDSNPRPPDFYVGVLQCTCTMCEELFVNVIQFVVCSSDYYLIAMEQLTSLLVSVTDSFVQWSPATLVLLLHHCTATQQPLHNLCGERGGGEREHERERERKERLTVDDGGGEEQVHVQREGRGRYNVEGSGWRVRGEGEMVRKG